MNWKGLIKQAHISEVRGIEPAPELHCKRRSQDLQQPDSIFRPCRSSLFELDDMPADLPAGLNLNYIDGSQCPLPSALNQITKTVKQPGGAFVCFKPLDQILRHRTIRSYLTCWSTLSCGQNPISSRRTQLQSKVIVHGDGDLLLRTQISPVV
jgi:hypothetical protein